MKNLKKIPKFNKEEQERDFWVNADSTDYLNYGGARKAFFPNLRPSSKSISIRLPEILIARLKNIANKKDIPYQTLIKVFLSEKVQSEVKLKK